MSCIPYPTVLEETGLEVNKFKQVIAQYLTSVAMRGPGSAYALTGKFHCMNKCWDLQIV